MSIRNYTNNSARANWIRPLPVFLSNHQPTAKLAEP
jgi:hypothetical protein